MMRRMKGFSMNGFRMKRDRTTRLLAAATVLLAPAIALADDTGPVDGRMTGFREGLLTAPGSSAVTWLMLVGIGVVCMAVMFMSANRTHLD